MRKKIALAVSALAVAAAVGPVGSASAACINTVVGPSCVMPCSIVGGVYNTVDDALGDVLPAFSPNCVQ